MLPITIKPATKEDAPFVAIGLTMALHLEPTEEELQQIASICLREDVLYSYKHALIAFVHNQPAGLCLCYDGNNYHEIRMRTFSLFPNKAEEMDFEHFEDETGTGEYYIDSLAVMPEFRHQGIAQALMEAQLQICRNLQLPVATLLVDPDNPAAQNLYRKLGFAFSTEVYAFGQMYEKWAKVLE